MEEAQITAKKQVEEADISRQQSVDISRQDAAIAVAKKSEEQSQAEGQAAVARAEMVKQEENVITVRETSVANRDKEVKLIKAQEEAQMQAIDLTVAAEAEKQAADDKAEAVRTEAQAAADKIRILAEADQSLGKSPTSIPKVSGLLPELVNDISPSPPVFFLISILPDLFSFIKS
mgnify:CR=1 FL=1